MNILLVEDVEISRMVTENILRQFSEVTFIDNAKNGFEAIKKTLDLYKKGKKYDVIFMDIIMPITSGYQALESIRKYEKDNYIEENNRSKIVILSSLNSKEEIENGLRIGADKVFIKPISYEDIKSLFEEWNMI